MVKEERVMKVIWIIMSNLLVVVVVSEVFMVLMMILRAEILKVTNAI